MAIHIRQDADLSGFFKAVEKCKSEVYFETSQGDSLALRSALCRYIFFTLADHPEILFSGIIRFENPADFDILKEYLKMGENISAPLN